MNDIPRRAYVDQITPAELAIREAVSAVEQLPADTRLTKAVALLQQAQTCVADYVDGIDDKKLQEPLQTLDPWKATAGLRFVERKELAVFAEPPVKRRILQQRWISVHTGAVEWRDVPLVAEEKAETVERTPGGACKECNMAAGHGHYAWCSHSKNQGD